MSEISADMESTDILDRLECAIREGQSISEMSGILNESLEALISVARAARGVIKHEGANALEMEDLQAAMARLDALGKEGR